MRAANGTTMAFQVSSSHSSKGILGERGFGNSHAKLSKERKHRMREMATQKLSCAYHLDEIAASVATMQSTSSLEEVASLVLQRNTNEPDAKYVDFFHEKIPSRMLDESTSLEPLNNLIHDRPTDVSLLRTRAVTKIFKNDLTGAVADLTKALAIGKYIATQHREIRVQGEAPRSLDTIQKRPSDSAIWRSETTIDENNQPSSLIAQLLFHRAGVYFALACQSATSYFATYDASEYSLTVPKSAEPEISEQINRQFEPAHLPDIEARKLTRSYARRALRDYMSFLAFFDYTPGTEIETDAQYDYGMQAGTASLGLSAANSCDAPPKAARDSKCDDATLHGKLMHLRLGKTTNPKSRTVAESCYLSAPRKVYPISVLFAASTPAELSPYPAARSPRAGSVARSSIFDSLSSASKHDEAITYHPLLIEALHTLLLCHCLVQTSPKEHLRHAYMVARLTRMCDGYPIFLVARSPSRSDWTEVVRRADNWIGLEHSWESLCTPVSFINDTRQVAREQNQTQARVDRKREAIIDSLADERVHDEATFQAAIASRERRAEAIKDDTVERNTSGLKQWVQEDSNDCSVSSAERAFVIARWVKEAPVNAPSRRRSKLPLEGGKDRKGAKDVQITSM